MRQYFLNIWKGLGTIFIGMKITIKYFFEKPCTLQYPDETKELPDGYRGILYCNIDDCIGCKACERACPVSCIVIETQKSETDLGTTTNGMKKRFDVPIFDIDLSKCMWCNLCTEVCPTGCLHMLKEYTDIWARRGDMVYHFGTAAQVEDR